MIETLLCDKIIVNFMNASVRNIISFTFAIKSLSVAERYSLITGLKDLLFDSTLA